MSRSMLEGLIPLLQDIRDILRQIASKIGVEIKLPEAPKPKEEVKYKHFLLIKTKTIANNTIDEVLTTEKDKAGIITKIGYSWGDGVTYYLEVDDVMIEIPVQLGTLDNMHEFNPPHEFTNQVKIHCKNNSGSNFNSIVVLEGGYR